MTAAIPLGRFCWYELMTSDTEGAKAFYRELAGWGTAPFGDEGYQVWMNGEMPVGGLMKLPDELTGMGIPPHWLAYVSTPDVDQTSAHVEQLGGRILKAAFDVPGAGRIAVVADDQGVPFGLYTSASPMEGEEQPPRLGEFSWHELATIGHEEGYAFYSKLFGWPRREDFDMGPDGIYLMFGDRAGDALGGMYQKPAAAPGPKSWLYYILVSDADAAARKATDLGGQLLMGPMEVPGGDRIAVLLDPQGAAFAVHSRAAGT